LYKLGDEIKLFLAVHGESFNMYFNEIYGVPKSQVPMRDELAYLHQLSQRHFAIASNLRNWHS
jgi:hypothetical protein